MYLSKGEYFILTVNLIVVGKLKESYLVSGCQEYIKRLSILCKLNIIEIEEYRITDNPSLAQTQTTLIEEGKKIISKLPKTGIVIPMCIEGKQFSSEELSEKIADLTAYGTSNISFIIGGSYGLSDEVKTLGDIKLSMSKMTFPHQLARLMLLEQIYRCFSILNGSKYHK